MSKNNSISLIGNLKTSDDASLQDRALSSSNRGRKPSPFKENEHRLNVDIPETLFKKVRIYCANNDMTVKSFVIKAINSELNE